MLKYIPVFSVWRLSGSAWLVIAACAKTHHVIYYVVDCYSGVEALPPDSPAVDLRKLVPCRWQAMPAVQRANVRDRFHNFLISLHGIELQPGVFGGAEYA